MMRKARLGITIFVVALLFIITGPILCLKIPAKDPKWGINFRVIESSSTGATYEITRDDDAEMTETVFANNPYEVEKGTIFGWEKMSSGFAISSVETHDISVGQSEKWEINWEYNYGRMPSGLYRLSKVFVVDDETRIYNAPFVIVVWWEILFAIGTAVVIAALVMAEIHFGILRRIWRKKLVVGLILFIVISVGYILENTLREKISVAYWNYEIEMEEVSEKGAYGTFIYYGNEQDDIQWVLYPNYDLEFQERTWYGWKTIKKMSRSIFRKHSVAEGSGVIIGVDWKSWNWEYKYEELPIGNYRVKQQFELQQKDKDTRLNGNVYVVFTLE